MPAVHDRGGWPDETPIDRSEHNPSLWEQRTDAIVQLLGRKGITRTDEMRRTIESLDPKQYELGYYQRWLMAVEALLIEKGIVTREELDRKAAEL
ncbi:MAG TPA: nitrile hydratase [Chloroflexota bacterium]|nr:nitrile hydratase [Chloroflexota bacterium]